MNRNRKILTLLALVAFVVIIFVASNNNGPYHPMQFEWGRGRVWGLTPLGTALIVLLATYAGLLILLSNNIGPFSWKKVRRFVLILSVITAGLVAIAGLGIAIIRSQKHEQRREQQRKADIEAEASKHRIKPVEIHSSLALYPRRSSDFNDDPSSSSIKGTITNNSKYTLTKVTFKITVFDNPDNAFPGNIVGETTLGVMVNVPPHQVRAINEDVYFPNMPELKHGHWCWDQSIIKTIGTIDQGDLIAEPTIHTGKCKDLFEEAKEPRDPKEDVPDWAK